VRAAFKPQLARQQVSERKARPELVTPKRLAAVAKVHAGDSSGILDYDRSTGERTAAKAALASYVVGGNVPGWMWVLLMAVPGASIQPVPPCRPGWVPPPGGGCAAATFSEIIAAVEAARDPAGPRCAIHQLHDMHGQ